MYKVKIFRSIKNINKSEWEPLLNQDNAICKYDFLKAIEESKINDCKFFYLIILNDQNKIAAHTWVFIMSMDIVTLIHGPFKNLIDLLRKIFPNLLYIKITECGSPIALGNTLSIKIKEGEKRKEILRFIINTMKDIGISNKAKFLVIRDFYKKDIQFDKELTKLGFISTQNLPDVQMDISWNSFEEYMKDLRHHYRRFVKKCFNVMEKENIRVEIVYDYKSYVPRLTKLYLQCYENAKEYKREKLNESFFYKTNEYLKEKTVVVLLKKDNKIIGFAFFLLDDTIARLLYIGMDYKTKDKYFTYFNIFYQGLKFAIEKGFKKLELGVTTYDFKTRMGGKIITLYAYIKHLNAFLNLVFKVLKGTLFPIKKVKKKHPFHSDD